MKRRQFLATGSLALAGCDRRRGRSRAASPASVRARPSAAPASSAAPESATVPRRACRTAARVTRRVQLIAGGGVAGLAAARALRQRGIDDFVVLELEDSAGGNSRGGAVGGIACPLGAHYLPRARRRGATRCRTCWKSSACASAWPAAGSMTSATCATARRSGCSSTATWQDGLLPVQGVGAATLAQYRRFAELVRAARRPAPFAHAGLPGARLRSAHLRAGRA